jgi:hypothetical protein
MTKQQKIIGGIVLGTIVIGGGYYLYSQYKKGQLAPGLPTPGLPQPAPSPDAPVSTPRYIPPAPDPGGSAAGAAPQFSANKVLRVGSRGNEVKMIQRAINDIYRDALGSSKRISVDGVFGSVETLPAVRALTGKDQTTYAEIKNIKRRAYTSKGLPDPYQSTSPSMDSVYQSINPIGYYLGFY